MLFYAILELLIFATSLGEMKMKVLLIAPYSGLAEIAKQMRIEEYGQLDIEIGNLEAGVEIAKAKEANYDVIISRGGTAQMIQEVATIPVAHININGYDMLRALKLVNEFHEKFALVGFSNITKGATTLCDILDYDVQIITINNRQEVHDKLLRLKKDNVQFILGDVVTVQMAQQFGLKGILISSGQEALIDSLEESRRLHDNYKKVRSQFTLIEQMHQSIPIPLATYHLEHGVRNQNNDDNIFTQLIIENDLQKELHDIATSNQSKVIETRLNNRLTYVKVIPLKQDTVGLMMMHSIHEDDYPFLTIAHHINRYPIIGESEHSQNIRTSVKRLATNQKTTTIIGEVGTGKLNVAQHIHMEKWHHAGLLYVMDILKLKNSFSTFNAFVKEVGAKLQGTLIIKNIHALSHHLEHTFIHFINMLKQNVKIITITQKEYSSYMDKNNFNETLAQLLSEETLHLFPLRKRGEDIRTLVHHYVTHMYTMEGMQTIGIKEDALELLYTYPWPNNIRELQQVVKELCLLSTSHYITKEEVQSLLTQYEQGEKMVNNQNQLIPIQGTLKEMEAIIIRKVLEEENQNQTKAASRLAINRTTLWRKLNESS